MTRVRPRGGVDCHIVDGLYCKDRQIAARTKERDDLKAQDAVHWKTRRALLASNKALADELSDHEKVVEMTIAADLWGIERWQAATGKELTHPDKGQLVTWLLEQWDASKAEVANIKNDAETIFYNALHWIVEGKYGPPSTHIPKTRFSWHKELMAEVGNLAAEVERLKAERYLPLDCPICGRRRLCYCPEKNECECDKCGYSTEAAARDAKENSDG